MLKYSGDHHLKICGESGKPMIAISRTRRFVPVQQEQMAIEYAAELCRTDLHKAYRDPQDPHRVASGV